jgi:hypothetical protein
MRIVITSFTTPAVVFKMAWEGKGTETLPSGSNSFHISDQVMVDVARFLRADYITMFDRGNIQNTVTFNATRVFDDQTLADAFMLDLRGNVPNIGRVDFITTLPTGKVIDRYFARAAIPSVDRYNIGVTVFMSFTIIGGELKSQQIHNG